MSDAAVMVVPVVGLFDGVPRCREFGYLAELSHGLMLLVFAPWIVYVGMRLLSEIDIVLRQLQQLGRIKRVSVTSSSNEPVVAPEVDDGPGALISLANRRIFNPLVLLVIFCSIFGRTFGNEFYPFPPHKGDRFEVPFGYVQADKVAAYPRGEKVYKDEQVRIVHQSNGPRGPVARSIFWAFLILALLTHASFACVVTWLCLKFIFVCVLVVFSVANATSHGRSRFARMCRSLCGGSISLRLNLSDGEKRFGLLPLFDSFRLCFWLLLASGTASALALGTDSSRVKNLRSSINATGGVGLIPIVIVAALYVLFFVLSAYLGTYRNAKADQAAARVDEVAYAEIQQQRVASMSDLLPISASVLVFSFLLPFFAGDFRSSALNDGHKLVRIAVEGLSTTAGSRRLLCDQIDDSP